jgi:tetratricopeptide (TPR) repeat protein
MSLNKIVATSILKNQHNNSIFNERMGDSFFEKSEYVNAITYYNLALNSAPNLELTYKAHLSRANIYYEEGLFLTASLECKRANAACVFNEQNGSLIYNVRALLKDINTKLTQVKKNTNLTKLEEKRNADRVYKKAEMLYSGRNFEVALALSLYAFETQESKDLLPSDKAKSCKLIAMIYKDTNNLDKALVFFDMAKSYYKQFTKNSMSEAKVFILKGDINFKRNNFEVALQDYKLANDICSPRPEFNEVASISFLRMASAAFELGNLPEADMYCDNVILNEVKHIRCLLPVSQKAYDLSDTINFGPETLLSAEAYVVKGRVYEKFGDEYSAGFLKRKAMRIKADPMSIYKRSDPEIRDIYSLVFSRNSVT